MTNREAINEKKTVALVSVLAAVFLTASKAIVGLLTGSLGILAEALHSGLDLVAAVITYFSVRVSDKPPDREHHFGHGKIENLSALIETLLLLVTCAWIIYEAYSRLASGRVLIEVTRWSYAVVILSIIVDFTRSRAVMKVARKYNSQALEADALHFSTDIWSSGVVFIGLLCANVGWYMADSIAALTVAAIVIHVCLRLGRRAIDVLLDRAPDGVADIVLEVAAEVPEIVSVESVRVRSAGADTFVNLSINFEASLSIGQAHEIANRFEQSLCAKIPRCFVHLNQKPRDSIAPNS